MYLFNFFVMGLSLSCASAAIRSIPSATLSESMSRVLHPKPGPEVRRQLTNFNDLDIHAHTRFYAKTLNFGESISIGGDTGPFTVKFSCVTSGVYFNVSGTN